jgi:hypothetical protein
MSCGDKLNDARTRRLAFNNERRATMETYTIPQAAVLLKLSEQTIRQRCRDFEIGDKINGRLRLLTRADLARVRKSKRPVGNPNWRRKGR